MAAITSFTGWGLKSTRIVSDQSGIISCKNASSVHLHRSLNYSKFQASVSITSSGIKAQVAINEQPSVEATHKDEAPVVILTRAFRGFSKAIALAFGKAGCKVLLNYVKSCKEAEEVCREIEDAGGEALIFEGDVSKEEDVTSMIKTAMDAWGTIDVLVNNAGKPCCTGIRGNASFFNMDPSVWREDVNVNVDGAILCTKEVARIMAKKRKGKIINIVFKVGVGCLGGQSNYSSAKARVIGFTKRVAKEYSEIGLHVNAITAVTSAMTPKLEEEIEKDARLIIHSGGRCSKPEEIARLVEYLALNPASSNVTGQVLETEGGWMMISPPKISLATEKSLAWKKSLHTAMTKARECIDFDLMSVSLEDVANEESGGMGFDLDE